MRQLLSGTVAALAIIALAAALAVTFAESAAAPAPPATTSTGALRDRPLEGFGATTPGGNGGTVYEVTSLADSGPGTLRDAVSSPNRMVTFAVGGTIELATSLRVSTHHITIDGSTAPSPGITITAASPGVTGALLDLKACHDVIVRHLRIRDAPDLNAGDNVRIWDGAYNIVVDHCSMRRAGDGNLDISDNAHDLTVQWCLIAETVKNSLVRTGLSNLSFHHNLYVSGDERNPQLDDALVVDMVNNVIFDWASNYGTRVRNGSTANVVKNYYIPSERSDESDALVIESSTVYMSGNIMPPACAAYGNTGSRLPAPTVTEMSPEDALSAVLAEAGVFPRDAEDSAYVLRVIASSVETTSASWGQMKAMFR
jgi:pectate lyase